MLAATLPIFRFAPSPNGRLHLGHAYSALLNRRLAQKTFGRLLLRLEDIDVARCTPELARQCLEDLAWLGLEWEGPVRVQSQHFADYVFVLERLRMFGLTFPCFCSRSEVAQASSAQDPEGAPLYPGTCTHIPPAEAQARMDAGEPHSWRLHMQKALMLRPGPHRYPRFNPETMKSEYMNADPARWGDVILARKDIPTSYHLAVVLDDALQGITHIVRGQDLEAATDLHVLLQSLLKLPTPHYHHHALLKEGQGEGKLSKSKGGETLADLRARGLSPQDVQKLLPL